MIHYIWAVLMLTSIGFSLFCGNLPLMTEAIMEGAKEAVNLCIMMAAVVGLWSGIMEIASASGVIEILSRGMRPFLQWMFPRLDEDGEGMKYIASNLAANMLGLGWAATPAGLRAMEELGKEVERQEKWKESIGEREKKGCRKRIEDKGEKKDWEPRSVASDEMCTFLLLNISSIQLIPVNMIVYRSQYGSGNPTAIVIPGLIATMASAATAILFSRMLCKKGRNHL